MDIARVEGLRATATFYLMGCLLGGPREDDLEPEDWAEHRKELADGWQSWRAVVAGLVATSTIEEDAREQLEARYLGGQPSLLADAEAAWGEFGEMVDRMWSLAEDIVPITPAEQRRLPRTANSSTTSGSASASAGSPTTPGSLPSTSSVRTRGRWRSSRDG